MFSRFTEVIEPHLPRLKKLNLARAFAEDKTRVACFTEAGAGLKLEYAQQFIDTALIDDLVQFFDHNGLRGYIQAMFKGEAINFTENRAVLHTALRSQLSSPLLVGGKDIRLEIKAEFCRMAQLVDAFFNRQILGATGAVITDVVNLGIGGSDLGPRMVTRALRADHLPHVKVHFVANVDGTDLFETLQNLNPHTTAFIVASKSFTTQETLMNAASAKDWLKGTLGERQLDSHFIGITSQPERAMAWGIAKERIFKMWDCIGGRYSLWSSIGMPIALAIGMRQFEALLEGAAQLDDHFLHSPWRHNLPVLMALIAIINQNFLGAQSHAVLPYDQTLELLPAYLQQADMESNGKRVNTLGSFVDYQTGVVLWGGVGTNGQHAFHQLLHQGTVNVPVDFILPMNPRHHYYEHHQALVANCYGQKEALLKGRSLAAAYAGLREQGLSHEEAQMLAPHKVIPGNRPANLISFDQLNPRTLGALIALYEHKIFVQSLIWEINAFDQWGVELGKELAQEKFECMIK